MSYPKRCPKCDQFGHWCFCVFPVAQDHALIWLEYDASTQHYTAKFAGYTICLDNSAKASEVRNILQGSLDAQRDEHGSYGIPYTNKAWDNLLDVGKIV